MPTTVFKYVWLHSKREQIAILLLVAISLPFYFFSLDLPKQIVNQGIQGKGFEGAGSTQTFMQVNLPFVTGADGQPLVLFGGFQMEQAGYLIALSLGFLLLVLINGGFKFAINTAKGRLGERMLRRLRYELSDRVLRFPLAQIRRTKQAEVATMIKDEVEPLGGFIGDAFVTPMFQAGMALTAMIFIMVQSVWLGSLALAIVLSQAFIIPRLRRRILVLGKMRQLTARELAGRVGELIDGAVEIHAHDTSNLERADLTSRLGRIFHIRYEIYQRKFFVKFLNNFLSQLTPFLFYLVGGLLALSGRLDIGALVAVIAAYKDLPGPIKELIDWDQQRNDVQIKYEQVIEQFQPVEILDAEVQNPDAPDPGPLTGKVELAGVTMVDENDTRLLDRVGFEFGLDERVAVVGDGASGKEHLGMLLAGLEKPTGGEVLIGGHRLFTLPEAVTGRRIAYVGPDAYLFARSVRENLVYGLKHRPIDEPELSKFDRIELAESLRSANAPYRLDAEWIDYAAAGAADAESLDERILEVLRVVSLEENVYRLGLTMVIDPQAGPEVAARVLEARRELTERLEAEGDSDLVVRFHPDTYNPAATLAENLLFATPRNPAYAPEALVGNPLVMGVIEEAGLTGALLEMGASIARTMVEIFADLPSGHPFFEQFSFIGADDLPEFKLLVGRVEKSGTASLGEDDRQRLLALPMTYIEARHRLGLIDETFEERVVELRHRLSERIAEEDPGAVEPYRPDGYNAAASLQDNILFGRLAYGRPDAEETIGRAMIEALHGLGLYSAVVRAGLGYNVGIAGKRLSSSQRQKLAIARALLKRPDLLILNEAAATLDTGEQSRLIDRILEAREGRGMIWTLHRASEARRFDRIIVLEDGKVVEQGELEALDLENGALARLAAAS